MKTLGKVAMVLGLVLVGVVIGGVTVGLLYQPVLASFTAASLTEMALDARQIEQGEADAVLERKAQAIPGLVQTLDSVHRKHMSEQHCNVTLGVVKQFYEISAREVPESIRPILDPVPPLPPCKARKAESADGATDPGMSAQAMPHR